MKRTRDLLNNALISEFGDPEWLDYDEFNSLYERAKIVLGEQRESKQRETVIKSIGRSDYKRYRIGSDGEHIPARFL